MITIAKFLKDWETKNAKNVAKTGSFSMMALSLAACGGGGGGGGGGVFNATICGWYESGGCAFGFRFDNFKRHSRGHYR